MENSKQLLQGSKGAYDANCYRKHWKGWTELRKDEKTLICRSWFAPNKPENFDNLRQLIVSVFLILVMAVGVILFQASNTTRSPLGTIIVIFILYLWNIGKQPLSTCKAVGSCMPLVVWPTKIDFMFER